MQVNSNSSTDNNLVLIVEDNMINMLLLKTLIQKQGYEVVTATNGLEAIQTLESSVPCVILMDINMPIMNGYEATVAIRNSNDIRINSIPIIAVTAELHSDTREKVLNSGMNDYVPKPINIEELVEAINKLVK